MTRTHIAEEELLAGSVTDKVCLDADEKVPRRQLEVVSKILKEGIRPNVASKGYPVLQVAPGSTADRILGSAAPPRRLLCT